MWKFLIGLMDKELLQEALRNLIRQGFTVIILVAGLVFLWDRIIQVEQRRETEYEVLKKEVKACQDALIEMYRKDREENIEVLREATDVMRELKNEIKRK